MASLEGLKVVDLSRVLGGPLCAQILGDHGADVIKVEGPEGDETRTWGPPFDDAGMASYFAGINRNKRTVCVDVADPAGRELVFRLLKDADVLIENFKIGTLERWGMGYEEVLRARFPRLIHCRVTGFGATGPLGGLPGYDAAVQALSGLMSINGDPDGVATRIGVPIVDVTTGLNAVIGILMALQERAKSGLGQSVESALFDSALFSLYPHSINTLFTGKPPKRSGNGHPNIAPYDTYATATEPIFLAVGNNGQFQRMCEAVGHADLARDERYLTNATRAVNRFALKQDLQAAFSAFEAQALFEKLVAVGVPCGVIQNVVDALKHPHTAHRGMIAEVDGFRSVASPIKLSRTPASYRVKPQEIGQSTLTVLREAGLTEAQVAHLQASGVIRQTAQSS
ncbi:CoA transferase [Diaphorobacter sp. HDW4A]|uniref:CaiB/BaiF CoA transferase family protein n=1 Tax=Diaphorobacter sp. HDW4A TaxID=2714924 RepID=UPI00140B1283|nr:CaiB/BaiF CoA-transferase family protein [Diaphorobacter sp. HDW4A]QIL79207.1 CoA transferase [Diaphorobacter sp. HDW4A]